MSTKDLYVEIRDRSIPHSQSLMYSMLVHCLVTFRSCHGPYSTPQPSLNLEGVILRRNLVDKVVAEDRDLLHDVLAHARYFSEEEEGKETGYTAEASGKATTRMVLISLVVCSGRGM
jgi:hypothetical protein